MQPGRIKLLAASRLNANAIASPKGTAELRQHLRLYGANLVRSCRQSNENSHHIALLDNEICCPLATSAAPRVERWE